MRANHGMDENKRQATPANYHRDLCLRLDRAMEGTAFGSAARPHRASPRAVLLVAILLVTVAQAGTALSAFGADTQAGAGTRAHDGVAATIANAKAMLQRGDAAGAMRELESIASAAHTADYHALHGLCEAVLGRPLKSQTDFDHAIALRPRYAPYFLSAGLAAASFNNLPVALARLETALRLNPALPGTRYHYALLLAQSSRYAESKAQVALELKRSGPRGASDLELWTLMAHDARALKDWPETLEANRHILSINPNAAEAYAGLGEALYSLNRPEESMEALRKAIALDDRDAGSKDLLGRLFQQAGRRTEAIALFEAADRMRPGDREVIYRLFRLYHAESDTANAQRIQAELTKSVTDNQTQAKNEAEASRLNSEGMEREKIAQFQEAVGLYDRAAKADPGNVIFSRNAALLLCKMGRTQEAIERLRDLHALYEDDAETAQILSVVQEIAGGDAARRAVLPSPATGRN